MASINNNLSSSSFKFELESNGNEASGNVRVVRNGESVIDEEFKLKKNDKNKNRILSLKKEIFDNLANRQSAHALIPIPDDIVSFDGNYVMPRKQQHIKNALKRIDEDDFGVCQICGENIKAKRLEIDPSLIICFDCAK